ncbi:hypothetical protein J3R82DRAFT_6537 [Butyriboletus roseoflavus]|nr:hypothetical protein J3R82DRAFT_6537 [Butyriboletus roseoflavus]
MQVQMLAVPPRIPDFKTIPPSFVPASTLINHISRASAPRKHRPLTRKLPGPIAIFTSIIRTSGLKAPNTNQSALSGALAGGVCVLSLYPADTVESAIQTAEELRPPDMFTHSAHRTNKVGGFWETARAMYKVQGWRELYVGCAMTVAWQSDSL